MYMYIVYLMILYYLEVTARLTWWEGVSDVEYISFLKCQFIAFREE